MVYLLRAESVLEGSRMNRAWVESLHIQNFRCVRDATLKLTPLHALIGPNDSGKSTLLRAAQTISRVVRAEPGAIFEAGSEFGRFTLIGSDQRTIDRADLKEFGDATSFRADSPPATSFRLAIAGSTLLRLEPDALREPSSLIPPGSPIRLANDHGAGLPGLLDAIRDRGDGSFEQIADQLRKLFPTVKHLQLQPVSAGTKVVQVELVDGTKVSASAMSEGMLYFLAFAALTKVERTPILLVEEPENGLHPARVADVMRILRDMSETTQILIATHSPLVVNELKPEEVSVVTRDESGTHVQLIKDTPSFEERAKVYSLGELWLSYANGKDEAPLFAKSNAP
jgi:predicted ATPase